MANSFSQLDKRQQMMICIGVPAFIAIAVLYLSNGVLKKVGADEHVPRMIRKPGGVWQEVEELKPQIAEKEAKIARKASVEAQLDGLKGEIDLAEERLPLAAEKSEVRRLIEQMTRDVSATAGVVQFRGVRIIEAGVVKGEDYQRITYQTRVTADLNGLIKFIDMIEKNQRFMMVTSLSIRPGGQHIENDKVVSDPHTVSMDIVTFISTATATGKRKGH